MSIKNGRLLTRCEQKKKDKLDNIFLCVTSLIASVGMTFCFFTLERLSKPKLTKSPYNGNKISIDDKELSEKIKEVKEVLEQELGSDAINAYINDQMSDEEKKNLLLMYAIYENPYFSNSDLVQLEGYLQYLKDNPYINYEFVYKLFRSSMLLKEINLKDAAGIYLPHLNIIKLNDNSALAHECFHLEDIYLQNHINTVRPDYDFQDWFVEGFAEVLSSEYVDHGIDSYPVQCAAIRIFTEFLGSDKMLEVRSKGDFEIFVNAMVEKGIDKQELLDLLDVLNKYSKEYKRYCKTPEEEEEQKSNCTSLAAIICEKFALMYNKIYNEPTLVSPIFIYNLEHLKNQESHDFNKFNYFLFNKKILKNEPYPYMLDIWVENEFGDPTIIIKREYRKTVIYDYYKNGAGHSNSYEQDTLQSFLLEENKIK